MKVCWLEPSLRVGRIGLEDLAGLATPMGWLSERVRFGDRDTKRRTNRLRGFQAT